MIKMVRDPGDNEEVYDLTETPDFLLVQFCESILRHQDVRNPDVQKMLKEFVDALRAKVDNNLRDAFACTITYSQNEIRGIINAIDGMLEKVAVSAPA